MRAAAEPNDCAIGQNHFQAKHIITRDTIFKTSRTARVGGNIATNKALCATSWIGRVEQTLFLDCILQFLSDDAGLNDRDKIALVNLLDPVHPPQ